MARDQVRNLFDISTILVRSPKYGDVLFLIDRDDADLAREHVWHLEPNKLNYGVVHYAVANKGSRGAGTYRLHRLITQAPDDMMVDHINGNPKDNRKANLRLVTRKGNQHNLSRAKGIYQVKKTGNWVAQIVADGQHHYLGIFKTEEEARAAYLAGKRLYHPTAPVYAK